MIATIKPGDVVLACTPRKVFAVLVRRVWISKGGTVRVEAGGDRRLRPCTSFDARQCLTLGALESLSATQAEEPPVTAPAGVCEA